MAGIDTRFVLALYALGTESFGNGRVAALPRPAVGFPLEALRFFPPRAAEDGEKAHRFALHVNSRIVPPTGTPEARYLWDVYEEALDPTQVRLAERQPTAAETAAYEAARAFLTPEVMAAYGAAAQVLSLAKLRLGTVKVNQPAAGSAAEAAWLVELAAAQDAVQAAEVDLLVRCRATEVQQAVATVQSRAAAATAVAWSEHSDDLDLAKVGSLDGGEYLLTTFSPSDVVDGRGWASFELLPDRIDGLVGGLGPLAAGAGPADGQVRRMTVELTHVMVDRPWFDPGVFRSGVWTFADPGHPPVSDGADPAGGDYPYLVTGLVLARSLTLELASPPAGAPPGRPPLELGYLADLDFAAERLVPVVQPPPREPEPVELVPVDRSVLEVRQPRFRVEAERLAVQPRFRVDAAVQPRVLGLGRGSADSAVLEAVPVRRSLRAELSPDLVAAIRDRDWQSPPVVATPPVPPPAETSRTLVGADEVIVVAYLLEPVGPSPRPDPALHWT